jgi:hypothetical protein
VGVVTLADPAPVGVPVLPVGVEVSVAAGAAPVAAGVDVGSGVLV